MKKLIAASLLVVAGAAHAVPCATSGSGQTIGNTTDVAITDIYRFNSTAANASLVTLASDIKFYSTACAGAFDGNDNPYPSTNLGWAGDGLLNGGKQNTNDPINFPGGAFITAASPLEDLKTKGVFVDPGWIMLGKTGEQGVGFYSSAIGGNSTLSLDSFFTLTETSAGKGTWSFTPDAQAGQRLIAAGILGKNWFDQFALVFKTTKAFVVYDFAADLSLIGLSGLPLANDPMFQWSGSWDITNTLDKNDVAHGISHVSLWVRDPAGPGNEIPEPSVLALLGLGLFGIGLNRRRKS